MELVIYVAVYYRDKRTVFFDVLQENSKEMNKSITERLTGMKLGDVKRFPCDGFKKSRSVKQMAYQIGLERINEGLRYSCDVNKDGTAVKITVVKR